MYKLDLNKLAFDSLEPHRRKSKFLALVYTALSPFEELRRQFEAHHDKIVYESAITPQVHSLEFYLNGLYGLPYELNNRDTLITNKDIIYLEDTSDLPFYWVDNDLQSFIDDSSATYVAGQESYDLHNHFNVRMPTGLVYNSIVLTSQLNKFNQVNRKFLIQSY